MYIIPLDGWVGERRSRRSGDWLLDRARMTTEVLNPSEDLRLKVSEKEGTPSEILNVRALGSSGGGGQRSTA